MKTYSANPKSKAGANAINRSAGAGHGRVLNVHRESKGESIQQNANWLATGQKPRVPAAVSRQRYQQRKLQQQQQQAAAQNVAQKPAQKPTAPQTPPKPQAPPPQAAKPKLTVSDGKAEHAVDGKDLAGKFQFNRNTGAYAIEQVIKAQGFDGKPTITTDKAAFAAACKASNFIAKRGVGATDRSTLNAYDQALKTGEFYVKCSGGSVHGYGMYCASVAANGRNASSGIQHAQGTANSYAYGRSKKIYTMTLDKSAKVGTANTLKTQMQRDTAFQKACRNGGYQQDVGVYAAYKGYDAYIARNGRSYTDGSYSDYTVVLNRSKVIILET